mmetsp:Transcript_15620/g.37892  ORF Transcript_15620/g.37892 Transcript_15620/m.37892 type:complete len:215 (-) Transcript_15620:28-672(-)
MSAEVPPAFGTRYSSGSHVFAHFTLYSGLPRSFCLVSTTLSISSRCTPFLGLAPMLWCGCRLTWWPSVHVSAHSTRYCRRPPSDLQRCKHTASSSSWSAGGGGAAAGFARGALFLGASVTSMVAGSAACPFSSCSSHARFSGLSLGGVRLAVFDKVAGLLSSMVTSHNASLIAFNALTCTALALGKARLNPSTPIIAVPLNTRMGACNRSQPWC